MLAGVYLLITLHILHWKLAGRTLAPLELNEVMHTLELGIVTAGFVFMCLAALSALVFGRFFCSWGCHILALEDLCAWLLAKARIRPRPIRARLLLLVAPGAMLYMFVWPQLERILAGRPPPPLRIHSEAEGWASFVTTDFWRNLPGPWITVLTMAVCGFAIVYFLGSRGFCTYACPYGVLFGLADRLAPGRIREVGNCTQCGICTAQCQSHVRVHEEIAAFGKVVDPRCLKDLDCVSVCPERALDFGFTRPALLQSLKRAGKRKIRYEFSLGEEALTAVVFLASLFIFRGLYDKIPFLFTLGLGCILAYLAVMCVRLVNRENLRLNNLRLKRASRLTPSGKAFAVTAVIAVLFAAHSAVIRYHERSGERALGALKARRDQVGETLSPQEGEAGPSPILRARARRHLSAVERWGLIRSTLLLRRLATLNFMDGSPAEAERYLRRVLARRPDDLEARLALGQTLAVRGRAEEARRELAHLTAGPPPEYRGDRQVRAAGHELLAKLHYADADPGAALREYALAVEEYPDSPRAHLGLGTFFAETGRLTEAAAHLKAACDLPPESAEACYNLGAVLARLGREAEAIEAYRAAARLAPGDAEVRNNLGFLLLRRGEPESAEPHLRGAIAAQPGFAPAHFNLGRLLLATGRSAEAEVHLRRAVDLDARFAEAVAALD